MENHLLHLILKFHTHHVFHFQFFCMLIFLNLPPKQVILDLLLHESKSIPEAIAKSKLPKASTYNRIKELIQDGLLTMVGFTNASDGRKVNEYATTFNKTVFEIHDETISINATVQSKFLKDSFAYNSIYIL